MPFKDPEKRREYIHKWYLLNQEKLKERSRSWYAVNTERGKQQRKKWYLENRKCIREKVTQRRRENIEEYRNKDRKYREENRDEFNKRDRERYCNPERKSKCKTYRRNRKARVRGAQGSISSSDVSYLYQVQKGVCANLECGKSVVVNAHLDHILPISLGGSNLLDNLQLLCSSCNLRKWATDPVVWAKRNGFLFLQRNLSKQMDLEGL